MHSLIYYLNLRKKYKPKKVKCIIIAESPPSSGKYFYDNTGLTTEPLFAALMKIIKYKPLNKEKEYGLKKFQKKGFYLMDSTYRPIDKLLPKKRNIFIKQSLNLNKLLLDPKKIRAERIPILLIKKNVCQILNPYLAEKSFNVINNGVIVPFPAYGNQSRFHKIVLSLLRKQKLY